MGNILGAKPTVKQVTDFVQKHWNHGSLPLVQYFKKGWFSFKFDSEEAMNAVLNKGPWKLKSNSIVLKQWTPYFSCIMESVAIVPIWILFPDLDPYLWTDSVLSKMASKVGKPLFADLYTTCHAMLSFARVLVEADVSKELPDQVVINAPFIGQSTQRIVYEWLPYYCKTCHKLGHLEASCKLNRPVVEKDKVTQAPEPVAVPKVAPTKGSKQVYRPVPAATPRVAPPDKVVTSECHELGGTIASSGEESLALSGQVDSECLRLGSPDLGKSKSPSPRKVVMHSGSHVLGYTPCQGRHSPKSGRVSVQGRHDLPAEDLVSPNKYSVLVTHVADTQLVEDPPDLPPQ
ncbi:uncharacterized protein LOC141649213 [Silene latifolia]|uniref:uncharacterized protein LOC141649213 n=1 Tax=Silene latifolia TaxID=37657 RepID=UPI003D77FBE9